MYFSKLEPAPDGGIKAKMWLGQRVANPYRLHQLLFKFFPESDEEKKRPYLYREVREKRRFPKIYLLSEEKPEALPAWRMATKPYQPQVKTGDHLIFSLRANPVVCQYGKRHDVVMAQIHPLKSAGKPYDRQRIVREAGLAWLRKQAERCGFQFQDDAVRVGGYRQNKLFRSAKKESDLARRPIQFASLEFDGALTVTDPVEFLKALQKGIGRSKGFGCGLLLVKRA